MSISAVVRCNESYPCCHDVTLADGTERCLNGVKIFKVYENDGLTVPEHLEEYRDWEEGIDDDDQ